MANLTLLPDEDSPNPPKRHHAVPPIVYNGDHVREMSSLPLRFDPQSTGFGIVGQRILENARFELSPHPEPTNCEKPAEEQK